MVKNNACVHTNKTCLPSCSGKEITADGEGTCPSSLTAPNRPPGTFRGEEAPQAPPACRHPRQEEAAAAAAAVSPLAPSSRLCCGNRAGSRADTHRHGRRESERRAGEAGAAQRRGRSLAAAPLLRSVAPAGPARRRAGRGGASAGREGSRAPGPPVGRALRRGLSTDPQKPGGWRKPLTEHGRVNQTTALTEHHRVNQITALSATSSLS